jgi:hypothetical protein
MLACALSWLWGACSPVETTAIELLVFAERNGVSLSVPITGRNGSIPGIAIELNMPISINRVKYQS